MTGVIVEVSVILAISLVVSWEVCWYRPHRAARRAEEAEDAAFWDGLKL